MKLYTATELADILGLHVKTVYKYGRQGKLEHVKVGKSVRFFLPQKERKDDKQRKTFEREA